MSKAEKEEGRRIEAGNMTRLTPFCDSFILSHANTGCGLTQNLYFHYLSQPPA